MMMGQGWVRSGRREKTASTVVHHFALIPQRLDGWEGHARPPSLVLTLDAVELCDCF